MTVRCFSGAQMLKCENMCNSELMKHSKVTGQIQPLAFRFLIWDWRICVSIIDLVISKMSFYH